MSVLLWDQDWNSGRNMVSEVEADSDINSTPVVIGSNGSAMGVGFGGSVTGVGSGSNL